MGGSATLRYQQVIPEPTRFWIRHAPVRWPGPEGWWIDLARSELASRVMRTEEVPGSGNHPFQEAVYIPPLDAAAELLRQEVLERCADLGVPAIQQILPDDSPPAGVGTVVVDVTDAVLHRRIQSLRLEPGLWVLWPVIPGLTDNAEVAGRGFDILEKAGVRGIVPLALDLSPSVRRELAGFAPASAYSSLFHGDGRSTLATLTGEILGRGLEVFSPRPSLASGRRAGNRSLAAHFAVIAELWLRCGRPEGRAQEFYRTSRRLEDEPIDVSELARRGSLGGVDWLDESSREEIVARATGTASPLLSELDESLRALAWTPGGERDGEGEE